VGWHSILQCHGGGGSSWNLARIQVRALVNWGSCLGNIVAEPGSRLALAGVPTVRGTQLAFRGVLARVALHGLGLTLGTMGLPNSTSASAGSVQCRLALVQAGKRCNRANPIVPRVSPSPCSATLASTPEMPAVCRALWARRPGAKARARLSNDIPEAACPN